MNDSITYTTSNSATAQELLQLHRVEALARHLAARLDGGRPNWRGSIPTFIPAGLGSTARLKSGGGSGSFNARQQRLELLEAAELATPEQLAALYSLRYETANPYGQVHRDTHAPLARIETLYVHVPAITITNRAGAVLVDEPEQVLALDTARHSAAWDLAREVKRSPLHERMGRLHWRPRATEEHRAAWLRLVSAMARLEDESEEPGAA